MSPVLCVLAAAVFITPKNLDGIPEMADRSHER